MCTNPSRKELLDLYRKVDVLFCRRFSRPSESRWPKLWPWESLPLWLVPVLWRSLWRQLSLRAWIPDHCAKDMWSSSKSQGTSSENAFLDWNEVVDRVLESYSGLHE